MKSLIKICLVFTVFSFMHTGTLHAEYRKDPMLITTSTVIDRDLEFDHTAFVIKGSNIVLDLGGHTITFNNANYSAVPNGDFEQWSGGLPTGWQTLSGTAQQVQAIYFGNYDLSLSGGGVIRSSSFNIKGGKTYLAYAFVKGPSTGTATLRLRRASDLTILAEKTWGSSTLSRGFASAGGVDSDLRYKPVEDTAAVLELECAGTGSFIVGSVDIKPTLDYGVTCGSYYNATYHPDLPSTGYWGTTNNITIRNGRLVQGVGRGVRCMGVRYQGQSWTFQNLTIEMNGVHTDGIYGSYPAGTTIDTCSILSTSPTVLNRMHGTGGIKIDKPTEVTEIKNSLIEGVPEMGIMIYACIIDGTSSYRFTDNTIRQKETVTEGYAIGISGVENFEIAGNTIEPFQGRGILVDAATGCSTGSKGTVNGVIRDNQILNLYEVRNPEYDFNALEAVGIRIRNWGAANQNHKNLKIYGNRITGTTDSSGVHQVYGINATVNAPEDSIEIYNNEISVRAEGAGRSAAAIAIQNTKVTGQNHLVIRNNILESNVTLLKFGGNDGENSQGVVFEGNTFRRIPGLPVIAKPFLYGYWIGKQFDNMLAGNTFADSTLDPSLAENYQFDGTGEKILTVGRHRMEVVVNGDVGSPLAGVPVVLKDGSGNTLLQRLTDSTGKAVIYSPAVHYHGNPSPVNRRVFAEGESFTVTVAPAGLETQSTTIAMSRDEVIQFNYQGDAPSTVRNLRLGQQQ